MDMAASVRDQVDDLMGSVYDPGLLHGFRRVSEAVYKSGELGRNNASRELDGALHLPAAGDRHDAGEDRDSDPGFPEAIQVIVVDRVVEEHLRSKKITARIYFFFYMTDVLIFIESLGMFLGIAGSSDACVRILGADLLDKLNGVLVISAAGEFHILGNISPEGKDVLNTGLTDLRDLALYAVSCGTDTGEVGHGGDAFFHDIPGDLNSVLAGAASGTVCAAHKGGTELCDLAHGGAHRIKLYVGLWGKDLHGNRDRV